ncbi:MULTISPECIES: SDR family NAD(P)-dependent oxidoreductase [Tenacibaculum]|uniref:SDR family NAD(P)-dependent oxidoreductase n=1 Tax=Tenacibaculum TaxID=104267 RepID=UPI00064B3FFC|nr:MULTISPECIES: SDR family NAD(P)-dependent oxidoreductase [Tenacibaculum]MCG7501739.1 SDR family NAD(P)-dependent oxidoreductase [Tenacibaculum sp. Mcav3-52]
MNVKRTAVVTDSGNGLGRTFANTLLKNEYNVILAATQDSFDNLSIETDDLHKYKLVRTDFTSDESVFELKNTIINTFGHLDLLFNNVEKANGFGQKIEQINIEEVKSLYEMNVFAVMRTVKILKSLFEKSEDPRIINVTSAMGDLNKMSDESFCYSNYCMTAYASSKAALNMYTHLQSKEFSPSRISVKGFDPIALKNCTHNSVVICNDVMDELLELISYEKRVK